MNNVIEIKAESREKAVIRAIKILEIASDENLKVTEIQKPKSLLGLFSKDGIYKIELINQTVSKEEKEKEILSVAKNLLEKMGLNLKFEKIIIEDRLCNIILSGEDNAILIGKKGKTLNSYEYILNILIKDIRVEVDVENFKEKRKETLRELAKKMSEKALTTTRPIKLNPMPSKERRIIHEEVNKYPELDTYSEGREPKRYIVIRKKR